MFVVVRKRLADSVGVEKTKSFQNKMFVFCVIVTLKRKYSFESGELNLFIVLLLITGCQEEKGVSLI